MSLRALIGIKPCPRIQRTLELTTQHHSGEINGPRANYSRKYGSYSLRLATWVSSHGMIGPGLESHWEQFFYLGFFVQ